MANGSTTIVCVLFINYGFLQTLLQSLILSNQQIMENKKAEESSYGRIDSEYNEENNHSSHKNADSKATVKNPTELKKIQQSVSVSKNRVALLRQQLEREKESIKKNKKLTQQVIQKKLAVNEVNQLKQKDSSEEMNRIQYLRKRNKSMRLEHERSLENIQKALYLVKLDDAREVKNISLMHKKRMKEMEEEYQNSAMEKKRKQRENQEKAKEKYMNYWRDKLTVIYAKQAMNAQEIQRSMEEKAKQMKDLEQEEMRLLQEINIQHSRSIQAKKQYVAALSLPVREVAEALGTADIKRSRAPRQRNSLHAQSLMELPDNESHMGTKKKKKKSESRYLKEAPFQVGTKVKMPHVQVSSQKFKAILHELKKIDDRKKSPEKKESTIRQENYSEEDY